MERLNKSGRALLEYRSEYKKHYSDSIDESLKEAVQILFNEKKIDEKVFRNIFNESISDEDFQLILSKKKEYTKNTNELNYEFDQVRKKINEYMIEVGFTNSMNTKNSLDINKIIIIHQFDLNKQYVMSSFGVNQTEMVPLMKRRGFVEKFAVLRLNQVLKEIYSEMKMPEHVDHGYSLVYYNKKTQGFSIDYKFYINVDIAANEPLMKELILKIKELDKIIDKKFHNKLGNSYFVESKNNQNALKMENPTKPTTKQSNIQPVQNVVEKAKKKKNKDGGQEQIIPPEKKEEKHSNAPTPTAVKEATVASTEKEAPKEQPKEAPKKPVFEELEIDFDVADDKNLL